MNGFINPNGFRYSWWLGTLAFEAVWIGAVGLGLAAVLIIASTFVGMTSQLNAAESKIEAAQKHFERFSDDAAGDIADEQLLKSVDETPAYTVEP